MIKYPSRTGTGEYFACNGEYVPRIRFASLPSLIESGGDWFEYSDWIVSGKHGQFNGLVILVVLGTGCLVGLEVGDTGLNI